MNADSEFTIGDVFHSELMKELKRHRIKEEEQAVRVKCPTRAGRECGKPNTMGSGG